MVAFIAVAYTTILWTRKQINGLLFFKILKIYLFWALLWSKYTFFMKNRPFYEYISEKLTIF